MGDRTGPNALEPLPVRNPKVAARVINGEAMILTPHDSVLHTLNAVATRIWELLPERPDQDAMVDALVAEYDVDRDTAAADIQELMASLLERQIVVKP